MVELKHTAATIRRAIVSYGLAHHDDESHSERHSESKIRLANDALRSERETASSRTYRCGQRPTGSRCRGVRGYSKLNPAPGPLALQCAFSDRQGHQSIYAVATVAVVLARERRCCSQGRPPGRVSVGKGWAQREARACATAESVSRIRANCASHRIIIVWSWGHHHRRPRRDGRDQFPHKPRGHERGSRQQPA